MKKVLLLSIAFLAFVSCETGETNNNKITTAHIYAVGNNGNNESYITKDGVSTVLGTGYYVTDVFVQGNDVYTCGSINGIATYTKNGVHTTLGNSANTSYAYKLAVIGNDVYAVGNVFDPATLDDHPAYWKNGVQHILDIAPNFKGRAYDIKISNNDVYIAGYQHNFDPVNPITNILYWKNEVLTTVNSSRVYSFNYQGEISIAIDNNDVYLAVNERDNDAAFNGNAYLIKNGTEETLVDDDSEVIDIFISNSDVYLCGSHINSSGVPNKSIVWKNGTVVVEKDNEHGAFISLWVKENNIFAVGIESNMVSASPPPLGTNENHATTLINNVFSISQDFGEPVGGSGYVSVFVTE